MSVYEQMDNKKTDRSITLTFGHSKKHRKALKQRVRSMSLSSDHAFPLFHQSYDGNAADVSTYVEQWSNLIDRDDFLYVGDSTLICRETMAYIRDNEGFFLAPAPLYESYKAVFEEARERHTHEDLRPYNEGFNMGFEVPMDFE